MRARYLLPLALALVTALGTADGTPLACAEDCNIQMNGFAYLTPVLEIVSGATVTWESLDETHVTHDDRVLAPQDPCFVVSEGADARTDPVLFERIGDTLTADQGDGPVPCANAEKQLDGTLVLKFRCVLHPTMHGALVIEG